MEWRKGFGDDATLWNRESRQKVPDAGEYLAGGLILPLRLFGLAVLNKVLSASDLAVYDFLSPR